MNGKQRIEPDLHPDLDLKVGPRSRRLRLIPLLPTLLTLGNLFCGFLALAYTTDAVLLAGAEAANRMGDAGWMIFLAIIFDALDGRVARITGQVTAFGGQLDSLADMVTFGVAPAFMTMVIAEQFVEVRMEHLALGFCCIYVLCAALRLARYNVEKDPEEGERQSFMGLPSPGAAGLVAGMILLYAKLVRWDWESARYVIVPLPYIAALLGVLMFSRIPYPHAMNRFFRGKKPMKYLVVMAFVVVLAMVLRSFEAVLAGALVIYVLIGPTHFLIRLVTGRAARAELDIFD
ncbi:MAG: CDP-diacylglycerol--serine O-phosphatidyltransferase [Planctomycetota bacterium]|jgi:CDP-diacylglycerol--serine O-phosphatidyltransferase